MSNTAAQAADASPPESMLSNRSAQVRLDALEAILMLLAAGGSIRIAHGQIASIEEWVRTHAAYHTTPLGREMLRLVTLLENIAEKQERQGKVA